MTNKLSGMTFLTFSTILLSLATAFACTEYIGQKPEEVVKKYWEYCMKQDFEKAAELTCINRNCVYAEDEEDTKVKTSGISEDRKITDSDDLKSSPVNEVKDFPYYGEHIIIEKVESFKIVEVKASKSAAQVIVDAEKKDKSNIKFINCLKKEGGSDNWRISSLHDIGVYKYSKDPCSIESPK